MFRMHEGRDPDGKYVHMYVPYADNPKKEAEFVGALASEPTAADTRIGAEARIEETH